MESKCCHLRDLCNVSEKPGAAGFIWQRIKKLRHSAKKRKNYFVNILRKFTTRQKIPVDVRASVTNMILMPGDMVRVRSKEEIKATLNGWNHLKGCGFMEEMFAYCGTSQRVLKRVEKFLDERDYLVKKCRGIVILEGIICNGTKDFGPCDRSCFFFWREEWLERVQ